jgi:methylenetetrahydrofolate dehydrogenase (NADP+)/methenyltetrahydrofolate cyclohydrolase
LTPTSIIQKTENKEALIKNADIIISGIGQGEYLAGDMLKKGVVIIDAGTSESGAGIVGDVDLESVKDIAGLVSPVPGGVGPVTVAMLLKNVLGVAKLKSRS